MRESLSNGAPRSYERPNQPWICGLACEGRACPAGPTARGRCPELAECRPIRDGDRWQCNRSSLRGGPCETGPTPDGACPCVNRCTPVRSLRARRGRLLVATTLATAGALLILTSANWRDRVISPGPLAAQHAQLLEPGDTKPSCTACHAAAEDGVLSWSVSLVVGPGDAPTQSQLCMECHRTTIEPMLSLAAHNLPPEQLAQLTKSGSTFTDNVACARCHHEHQGIMHDLTAIDNDRCQACHQQRYDRFAGDHPDFGAWPYERRTRIIFDHASHMAKHFAQEDQPFDCRTCHLDDAAGNVQLTANYETTCASCHDAKIKTSVMQGVPMLALPIIDVDALQAAGIRIGAWPAMATGDFDGALPPTMKLLLAADPAAARAMETLGPDFEFIDIDPDDSDHVRAAGDLAVAIKKLLTELSRTGPSAIRKRLEVTLGSEISDAQLQALTAGLSVDTLRPAVAQWLPDVDPGNGNWNNIVGSEFGIQDSGLNSTSEPRTLNPEPSYDPAGAWSRDDTTFTIQYQPTSHADPVLAGWISLVVDAPNTVDRPLVSAMLKEMSAPTAPGLCGSCHSVEQTGSGQLLVNWRSYNRSHELRGFTKFSHGPHLVLPELADCTECHAVDTSANTAASYADWNPHTFASEFMPISKQACAECHTAKAAGDQCQACHNYHVQDSAQLLQRRDSSAD